MADRILEVKGLKTYFFTEAGVVKAVDGVDLHIERGETLGLVGESGSGKTVTALSIMRIVPRPGKVLEGSVVFDGADVMALSEEEVRRYRGPKMAIIFQDPTSSLNPVYSIENQLTEILMLHRGLSKEAARDRAIELLKMVGIPEAEVRIKEYPHQFSGGMKQRVSIARAIALEPALLFADEPTTNLDVTIQAQVLELLRDLKKRYAMSLVMITHDMGIIAETCERVTVLYAGRVAETAPVAELFKNPLHPYTEALLKAVPRLDRPKTLQVIPGSIPNLIEPPTGCRYHPRCKYAIELCKLKVPDLEVVDENRRAACHRWRELDLVPEGG